MPGATPHLIGVARSLHGQDAFGLDLDQSVYAIDSTTIDLCLKKSPDSSGPDPN